jgi:hypothetical protein
MFDQCKKQEQKHASVPLSTKNRQMLSILRKTSAESMSWVMYPSKNIVLGLRTGQCLKNVAISHGCYIFAHIQVGGGLAAGGGGKPQNREKVW